MQAMILAAGFGTRLLPYTTFRPKPLFPIVNRPLLQLTIQRLRQAGFDHIVVNCHHLRRQVIDLLRDLDGVRIQEEDEILGSGGGLRQALGAFRDEPVLITNGDIYHSVDFGLLYRAHLEGTAAVTMAMHDFPRFNKVVTRGDAVVSFDAGAASPSVAFTGLHVINPELLEPIPPGVPSSIIDYYRGLLRRKVFIRCLRVDGCFWTDIGTIEDYLNLHGGLLGRRIPWWPELGPQPETPFYLAGRQEENDSVTLGDWVCAGRVRLGRDVRLTRVVLWDGASVPDGARLQDTLVPA